MYGCYQITVEKVNKNCDWHYFAYFAVSVQSLLQMNRERKVSLPSDDCYRDVASARLPNLVNDKLFSVFHLCRMKVAVTFLVCILSSIQLVIEGREDGNNVFLF